MFTNVRNRDNGGKMELNNRMMFYCIECDTAPVEAELNKDNFYVCKDCGVKLAVIKKDDEEQ